MNRTTALLDVSQMGEADRLAVAAGVHAIALMENVGSAVAREIMQRWKPRPDLRPGVFRRLDEHVAVGEALICSALLPAMDGGLAHHARKCWMQRERVRTCAGLETAGSVANRTRKCVIRGAASGKRPDAAS